MIKSWRLEGWETKIPWLSERCDECSAYEDGADAMLEALFKLAKDSPTKTFVIDSQEVNTYLKGEE